MPDQPQEPTPSPDWKKQALLAWRSFADDKRRLWITGIVIASCAVLFVWSFSRPNAYVDGVGVLQDADWVELRDLVWEDPSPLIPELNSSEDFYDPSTSSDNLTLVFVKGRPSEGADLWTMDWNGKAWTNLHPIDALNTVAAEIGPDLSPDGNLLYFSSDRKGGLGGYDLWVSRRGSEGEWGEPVNLGENLNSAFHEYDPAFHDFSGRLYFSSNRPKRPLTQKEKDSWKGTLRELRFEEDYDLFSASFTAAGEEVLDIPSFDPAERAHSLNTNFNEGQTALTARGDFLYFSSDRKGGEGGYDLYRSRIYQGEILPPENLGRPVNTTFDDMDPTLTMEGHHLLFSSDRESELARPSGVLHFGMYRTIAREVTPMRLDEEQSGVWSFLDRMKWWILLLVASLIALYYLLRQWSKAREMGVVGLRTRCMIGFVLFHVMLALLFSLKELVQEVIEFKEATVMEANLDVDALAVEKEALDIREETTELPEVQESSEVQVAQQYVESYEASIEPAEAPTNQSIEDAFVADTVPAVLMEVPPPKNSADETAEDLSKPETQSLSALSFALPKFQLEQAEPHEAQAEPEFREFDDVSATTRADSRLKPVENVVEKTPTIEMQEDFDTTDSSAVQSVDAPQPESEPSSEELTKVTEVDLPPARVSLLTDVALEAHREVEQGADAPKVESPTDDATVAKAAALAPNTDATVSPDRAQAEIRGGELAMAESTLRSVEAPKNANEESDNLENLSQAPLFDSNSTSESPLALQLEGPTQTEEGDDDPDITAPSVDAAVAKAANLQNPTSPDEAQTAGATIRENALTKFSAATQKITPSPSDQPATDSLAIFRNQPAPLAGGPKIGELASIVRLEDVRDLAEGAAATEIASIAADSGVGKLASLSAVAAKPLASPKGLGPLTGLQSTESALMKLPRLSLSPRFSSPTAPDLINPVSLRLPVSGLSPRLSLESKPSTDNPYILRDPKQRARVLERLGGTEESEEAVSRALDWFSRNQEKNGRWSINKHGGQNGHDVASTSFALLCYFGWGAKHNEDGPYRETVDNALSWLLTQVKDNGDITNGNGNGMYDQGVATLVLAEAYGLTKDPALRKPLQQAVDFVVKAQNQKHGAWDYRPRSNRMDTSVSGWQLMALKSAALAGVDVPKRSFELAGIWLDRVSTGSKKGIYGYDRPGHKTPAMVAEGMFSQQLLGKYDSKHERMKESAANVLQNLPKGKSKQNNYYYWYYGCLSMYMHKGESWAKWNPVMRQILLDRQIKGGSDEGSWDYKHGKHSGAMGRVISTAMATLSLEVYYRYLPSAAAGAATIPGS
ncbi:MAG: hypothetical protein VB980_04460 [Opitutales bacterium]